MFGRRHLGAFLVSEMLFSPRSPQGFLAAFLSHVAEISPLISPRFWPQRFSSHRDLATNLGAFLAAEISPLISAAKNVPTLVARSRRDENLGGQKRADISGEISRDLGRDCGEMKISAAKNAPRSRKNFHKGAE